MKEGDKRESEGEKDRERKRTERESEREGGREEQTRIHAVTRQIERVGDCGLS